MWWGWVIKIKVFFGTHYTTYAPFWLTTILTIYAIAMLTAWLDAVNSNLRMKLNAVLPSADVLLYVYAANIPEENVKGKMKKRNKLFLLFYEDHLYRAFFDYLLKHLTRIFMILIYTFYSLFIFIFPFHFPFSLSRLYFSDFSFRLS